MHVRPKVVDEQAERRTRILGQQVHVVEGDDEVIGDRLDDLVGQLEDLVLRTTEQ